MAPLNESLPESSLDTIFNHARTHSHWKDISIDPAVLKALHGLLKMAPTSANCSPGRFVFVRSTEAKQKLLQVMDQGNVEKTKTAPVTAIIAYDMKFYEKLPKLFPHTDAKSWFEGNQSLIQTTAFRNGTLQGAYLILAARSLGLDCGPMSGFNNEKCDELFFKGTSYKSNFLCNLGYADHTKVFPRSPRFNFEEACQIV